MSKILKIKVDNLYALNQRFIVLEEIKEFPDNIKSDIRNIVKFGDNNGYKEYVLNYSSGLLETTALLKNKNSEATISIEGYFIPDVNTNEQYIHYISLYDKDYNEYVQDGKSIFSLGEDYIVVSL